MTKTNAIVDIYNALAYLWIFVGILTVIVLPLIVGYLSYVQPSIAHLENQTANLTQRIDKLSAYQCALLYYIMHKDFNQTIPFNEFNDKCQEVFK